EILSRVINDPVCPNRAQHVQFPCAVHGSHLSPEVPGKLYRKRTYTSTRADNQNLLSPPDTAFPNKMHCFKPTNGKGGGFLIGYVGRFYRQHPFFRQTFVLGVSTQTKTGPPKNLV